MLEIILLISFTLYINIQLPQDLEIFLIGIGFFQNNLFPNIGAAVIRGDDNNPPYHTWFGNIIIDQDPYSVIKDRSGLSSSYFMNGLGHFYMSLITLLIYFLMKHFVTGIKFHGIKEKIFFSIN
jgi:hypothetical protein